MRMPNTNVSIRDDVAREELRRLREINAELLEALKAATAHMVGEYNQMGGDEEAKTNRSMVGFGKLIERCEAAIQKARGER